MSATEPATPAYGTPVDPARDDRVDASGPDRLVFFATLLLGVAFLSSVFMTGDDALAGRETKIREIEQAIDDVEGREAEFDPQQAERDAAGLVASLDVPRTGAWRKRAERAAGDANAALEAPEAPHVALGGDGTVAELTWARLEGVGVHVYRAKKPGQALRRVTDFPIVDTRWTEKLTELSGTYRYALQVVRDGRESDVGPTAEFEFRLPFEWRVVRVAPDRTWAVIEVKAENPNIPAEQYRVEVGAELSGTGLRLVKIEAATTHRVEKRDVPVFNPDGTRTRDSAGRAVFHKRDREIETAIDRVTVEPIGGGEPVVRTLRR